MEVWETIHMLSPQMFYTLTHLTHVGISRILRNHARETGRTGLSNSFGEIHIEQIYCCAAPVFEPCPLPGLLGPSQGMSCPYSMDEERRCSCPTTAGSTCYNHNSGRLETFPEILVIKTGGALRG